MNGDILSIRAVVSFLFIIASGYATLLWSYRDANKLDYFYNTLKDFDKATQTTFIGALIYVTGYFLSPNEFSTVFSEGFPSKIDFYVIAVIEVFLIIVISSILSGIIQKIHSKPKTRKK